MNQKININVKGDEILVCKNCEGKEWAIANNFWKPDTGIIGQNPMIQKPSFPYCATCGVEYQITEYGVKQKDHVKALEKNTN